MHSQVGDRALRILWGVEQPPARGPRARWSLSDVTRRAVELADRGGLDSVSLARLAADLGLTTTALYRYIDSKDALVELMVDGAVGPPPALTGATWQERARSWTAALRERYQRHPWLANVRATGLPRQPGPLGWIEALLDAMHDSDADGLRVALLLEGLVRNYAVLSRTVTDAAAPPGWLATAVPKRFPLLAASMNRDWSDVASEFEFAVDTVLSGLH